MGDVVDAVQAALRGTRSGTLDIGTGIGTSVNTLFREAASIIGYAQPARHGPARRGDIRPSALDPALAASELEWRASTSLRQGLAVTVESAREPG